MDVLSDVIATMRTGEPRSSRVRWHGAWGQRFPSVPGTAGFQVVLRGRCWLFPEDGPPLALAEGDVVLLTRGRGHGMGGDPAAPPAGPACDPLADRPRYTSASAGDDGSPPSAVTLCGAYELDATRAHPLLGELPDVVHLPAAPGRHPDLRAAVGLLGAELEHPRPGADAVVPALLDMLLAYILRAWFAQRPAVATGWAAALRDPAVGAALDAMHRDPSLPWTVEALGKRVGLSRAAFSRRFTAMVGRPPLAYLTWWRMTTAARLLRESDVPLGAVARRAGYTSEFAFSATFKRHHGASPGRYRRGVT
ncbi:AraC family transcriptional regulator [Sphaerisporangium krabiense]|uniref:AraC family transcriptional regulator n=1 Tax=Sphaerisporangium krabiense TaxID=763782 RepID=UPI001618EA6B|nr:AraC family transcriptional regulator [Sphaerisporangium krabiense]